MLWASCTKQQELERLYSLLKLVRSKKLHTPWAWEQIACEIWGWHWKYHLCFGTHFKSRQNKVQEHCKVKHNFKNHKKVWYDFRAKVHDGFSYWCNGSSIFSINSITINSYSNNKQMKACERSESFRRSVTQHKASSELNRVHTELCCKEPSHIIVEFSSSSEHQFQLCSVVHLLHYPPSN